MSLFFFNDTATTEIYTLSLHDALPISAPDGVSGHGRAGAHGRALQPGGGALQPLLDRARPGGSQGDRALGAHRAHPAHPERDRKSTRLNSSHSQISYAVFCLKKKKYAP